MVGDEICGDIEGAINAGLDGCLVSTGNTKSVIKIK
ncbi:HAD hydrolase-like protein [Psychromonas antarctica]|jgi:ribonucleotide monophosphatase NagD (HAD superfamily)|nr:HAD hydrolase-like protein [Psychromonas antarctica]